MGFKKHFRFTKEGFCRRISQLSREANPYIFLVNYELNEFIVIPETDWKSEKFLFNFRGLRNYTEDLVSDQNITLASHPISKSTYKLAFDKVMAHLNYGNSFLLNLTVKTPINPIDLQKVFFANSQPYRFLSPGNFVVFSPESFIRTEGNIIKTFPMKGTIDADQPNAESLIINNKKEAAEHATIVDLMRNDLSQIASEVKVTNYRYIDRIETRHQNLLQVSSEISGKLPHGWQNNFGDLLLKLLPAGSICGAPKAKTLDIISEAETIPRGFYTGVMGIFNGTDIDSAVMIRYIEQDNNCTFYRSGGGITNQSNLEDEYNEVINKIYIPR